MITCVFPEFQNSTSDIYWTDPVVFDSNHILNQNLESCAEDSWHFLSHYQFDESFRFEDYGFVAALRRIAALVGVACRMDTPSAFLRSISDSNGYGMSCSPQKVQVLSRILTVLKSRQEKMDFGRWATMPSICCSQLQFVCKVSKYDDWQNFLMELRKTDVPIFRKKFLKLLFTICQAITDWRYLIFFI